MIPHFAVRVYAGLYYKWHGAIISIACTPYNSAAADLRHRRSRIAFETPVTLKLL